MKKYYIIIKSPAFGTGQPSNPGEESTRIEEFNNVDELKIKYVELSKYEQLTIIPVREIKIGDLEKKLDS